MRDLLIADVLRGLRRADKGVHHHRGRGFWAVVIPGVVHHSQPLFNEKPGALVFSIEGQTLPVNQELAAPAE